MLRFNQRLFKHLFEATILVLVASVVLAFMYNGVGMGDVPKLIPLNVFSFATTLGSFASEYDAPGVRWRLYGGAAIAIGFPLLVLAILPALPLADRIGLAVVGVVLLMGGVASLRWIVAREAASAVGNEAPRRVAIATACSVIGILDSPFATYLTTLWGHSV